MAARVTCPINMMHIYMHIQQDIITNRLNLIKQNAVYFYILHLLNITQMNKTPIAYRVFQLKTTYHPLQQKWLSMDSFAYGANLLVLNAFSRMTILVSRFKFHCSFPMGLNWFCISIGSSSPYYLNHWWHSLQTSPNYYLDQCWLIVWHSPEINFKCPCP